MKRDPYLWAGIGTVFFCWLVWPVVVLLVARDTLSSEGYWQWEKRGQFGDAFGSLNTLFTGLAFVGLAFGIRTNRLEREARDADRKRDEREKGYQEFERHFFQLLATFRSSTETMATVHFGTGGAKGTQVFRLYVLTLTQSLGGPQFEALSDLEKRMTRFRGIDATEHDNFDLCFRPLHLLLTFLDQSAIPNKVFYADIIRAELSRSALCLLALYALTDRAPGLKSMIEKYHLLRHLPVTSEVNPANGVQLSAVTQAILGTEYSEQAYLSA